MVHTILNYCQYKSLGCLLLRIGIRYGGYFRWSKNSLTNNDGDRICNVIFMKKVEETGTGEKRIIITYTAEISRGKIIYIYIYVYINTCVCAYINYRKKIHIQTNSPEGL
jgi:hypothetical protein